MSLFLNRVLWSEMVLHLWNDCLFKEADKISVL